MGRFYFKKEMGRFYFNECLQRTANMAEKTIVKTFYVRQRVDVMKINKNYFNKIPGERGKEAIYNRF